MSKKLDQDHSSSELLLADATSEEAISVGAAIERMSEKQLAHLIKEIGLSHQKFVGSYFAAVAAAISAGSKLKTIRKSAGRGDWTSFFANEITPPTGIQFRTGQRYMAIAERWNLFVAKHPEVETSNLENVIDQKLLESFKQQESQRTAIQKLSANQWCTPKFLLTAAAKILGSFDTDPCAMDDLSTKRIAETNYLLVNDLQNGLAPDLTWDGRCWIAPGHQGNLQAWLMKGIEQLNSGAMTEGLLLLPVSQSFGILERYFPIAVLTQALAVSCRRARKRKDGTTEVVWKDVVLPTPMAVTYLSIAPNLENFMTAFHDIGVVYLPTSREGVTVSTTPALLE